MWRECFYVLPLYLRCWPVVRNLPQVSLFGEPEDFACRLARYKPLNVPSPCGHQLAPLRKVERPVVDLRDLVADQMPQSGIR